MTQRLRFPKSARLLTKTDYQAVFDRAYKVSDSVITLFACTNDLDTARLGLAISRKCSKRAVDRNRIKRALREAFRLARADLPALDFVVICRSKAVEASCATLGAALLTQINKVRQRICVGSS